jgi:hypothetical protein
MTDKEKAKLRSRIDRVKKQSSAIADAKKRWAKTKLLDGIENEDKREACLCALENQMGYDELMDFDPSFRRISIPIIRRIFGALQAKNVVSRHEGYKLNQSHVALPPVALECGEEFTKDLHHLDFLGEGHYKHEPHSMLFYEAEDTLVLTERLTAFIEDLATEFDQFVFLGLGYYTNQLNIRQMVIYADVEE